MKKMDEIRDHLIKAAQHLSGAGVGCNIRERHGKFMLEIVMDPLGYTPAREGCLQIRVSEPSVKTKIRDHFELRLMIWTKPIALENAQFVEFAALPMLIDSKSGDSCPPF